MNVNMWMLVESLPLSIIPGPDSLLRSALDASLSRFIVAIRLSSMSMSAAMFAIYHSTSPSSFASSTFFSSVNTPPSSLITFLTFSATSPASPTRPSVGYSIFALSG